MNLLDGSTGMLTPGVATTELMVTHDTAAGMVCALHCDSISIPRGTSIAIMGPSGCGKSTMLGLLAGLAVPTVGEVTIGDRVISALPERDRVRFRRQSLGMVYQEDNLLPHLTVEENVGLALSICRPNDRFGAETTHLLRRLGLQELAKRLPDQLSGGQRQRVAVARAVVHRPSLVLADEPTGSLDAENAAGVIELLVDVQREIGATLVAVTHDPAIAAHLDRSIQLTPPQDSPESPDAG